MQPVIFRSAPTASLKWEKFREGVKMDEKLIQRLESAVARLEALSTGGTSREVDVAAASSDPSIIAFEDLISQCVGRLSSAAEKIGGQVLDVTKVVKESFSAQKELLIKTKETQVLISSEMNSYNRAVTML